jgi:hypothetical protein
MVIPRDSEPRMTLLARASSNLPTSQEQHCSTPSSENISAPRWSNTLAVQNCPSSEKDRNLPPLTPNARSRDSAVGIATGYGLDDGGVRDRVPVESRISVLHVVQTGSGAHPASYPMGTGCAFAGGKAVGVWSWPTTDLQLMPRSRKRGSIHLLPHTL